ncbi:DNA-binding protein [Paenibacillus aceris]|uniref:DNA-directed RNA polymerase alpha subunit n=1 Tax=Paenibacillus aceris TaxID=869555 RepID=A0ABS4HSQ2_9BACL|nr:DNA-binding protein [Paenibacillus aceris]MBP1961550.1 DNA-directed RNA polymerase alpha subunit [Paenibacillus aceris]NHW37674.1 DNA-binding protein [Paenibacillus aceris]
MSTNKTQPNMGEEQSDLPAKLANPARRALASAGYLRLDQLSKLTESELMKLHGMGPKAKEQLRSALAEKGLTFADGSREQ